MIVFTDNVLKVKSYSMNLKNKTVILLFSVALVVNAEDILKESPFSASLELSTKYMWRGIEYGTAPTVFL